MSSATAFTLHDLGSCELVLYPLKVRVVTETPVVTTAFWTNVIRGAFGAALRSLTCVSGKESCQGCVSRTNCPYARSFDADADTVHADTSRGEAIPKPLFFRAGSVISPQEVTFTMTLVGPAYAYLPYYIHALDLMARRGLGPERTKGVLERVWFEHPFTGQKEMVYDRQQAVSRQIPGVSLQGVLEESNRWAAQALRLQFVTPWRLKRNGKLLDAWLFSDLLGAIRRRWAELNRLYGNANCASIVDTEAFARADTAVSVSVLDAGWRDQHRFSRRQGRSMTMGGIEGVYGLRGDLRPYLPALLMGSLMHVGKNVSFGLGCYTVEELSKDSEAVGVPAL